MNHEQCQETYLNLLRMLNDKTIPAEYYLREWEETRSCDRFVDFRDVRGKTTRRVTEEAARRVLRFEQNDRDVERVKYAMIHYRDWHKTLLFRALSAKNKVRYLTASTKRNAPA